MYFRETTKDIYIYYNTESWRDQLISGMNLTQCLASEHDTKHEEPDEASPVVIAGPGKAQAFAVLRYIYI